MITNENVNEVRAEIARLQDRIRIWQGVDKSEYDKPKESGAVMRASMDLTRSLAKLRRGS